MLFISCVGVCVYIYRERACACVCIFVSAEYTRERLATANTSVMLANIILQQRSLQQHLAPTDKHESFVFFFFFLYLMILSCSILSAYVESQLISINKVVP